jgi:hypothetical protein
MDCRRQYPPANQSRVRGRMEARSVESGHGQRCSQEPKAPSECHAIVGDKCQPWPQQPYSRASHVHTLPTVDAILWHPYLPTAKAMFCGRCRM